MGLERARIVPLVRKREAAGVPQHVRVRLEVQLCLCASALDHACKARRAERRAAFRREHEWRLWLLLALQTAECAEFITNDWVRARRAAFSAPHRQRRGGEVDLVPAQVHKL